MPETMDSGEYAMMVDLAALNASFVYAVMAERPEDREAARDRFWEKYFEFGRRQIELMLPTVWQIRK